MPNCKICGQPVTASKVFHPACWETQAEKMAEEFCDNYCRFPREALDEEILHKAHCDSCPMVRALNLGL